MWLHYGSRVEGPSSVGAGEGRKRGVTHVFSFSLGFCSISLISSLKCILEIKQTTKNKYLRYQNSDGISPPIRHIVFG